MGTNVVQFAAAALRLRQAPALPLRISALIPDWIASRQADGYRPRGVESYAVKIEQFMRFANDPRVTEITPALIEAFKRDMSARCVGGTTRHSLTVVRAFCDWCVAQGYLTENPALKVKHPKVTYPDPDPLSRAQIEQLLAILDAPPQSHKSTWLRNRRAVCLGLYAGLRIAEIAELRWSDIDLDRRTLIVRSAAGKGGKSRVIPICDELAEELLRAKYRNPDYAVVDQGDLPRQRGRHLTEKSAAHIYERWIRSRGMVLRSHQCRKTFATELRERGADIVTIQRLMGHSSPATTEKHYLGASGRIERDAVCTLTFRRR